MRPRLLAVVTAAGLLVAACVSTDPGLRAVDARPEGAPRPAGSSTTPVTVDAPITSPPAPTGPGAPTEPVPPPATEEPVGGSSIAPADSTPSVASVPANRDPNRAIPVEDGVVDFGNDKTARDYDGFLVAVVKDLETFWAANLPAVYGTSFEPLAGGVHAAYRDRTSRIPGCGNRTTRYRDVQGNAFYCADGDFMVYDDDELVPNLVQELGRSAIGIVLAHEFGHAIQQRTGNIDQPTVLKEQQADCFAGAWTAHIVRGESDAFQFDDTDVRSGLIAMIQVADPIQLAGSNDGDAHGTGFDRVGAFQDGFTGGVERCKPFFTEHRQLVNVPFIASDNNGNFPMHDPSGGGSDVATAIPKNLDQFWVALLTAKGVDFTPPTIRLYPTSGPFPDCPGAKPGTFRRNVFYCAATNTVMVDETFGSQLINNIGDMAIGYLISQGFSESVQRALKSPLKGEPRALMNDCLTGVWTQAMIPDQSSATPTTNPDGTPVISLAAGDLDEAVIMAIQRSDASTGTNVRGSAFEKIASFRSGVLNGAAACSVLQ